MTGDHAELYTLRVESYKTSYLIPKDTFLETKDAPK